MENRILKIFEDLSSGHLESAFTLACTLIDRAGKELYKIKENGKRFRRLIDENERFIWWFVSKGKLKFAPNHGFLFHNTESNEKLRTSQILWKIGRNSVIHNGELDSRLEFVEDIKISFSGNSIILPEKLLWAIALLLIVLPCYEKFRLSGTIIEYTENSRSVEIPIGELWNDREGLVKFFNSNVFELENHWIP